MHEGESKSSANTQRFILVKLFYIIQVYCVTVLLCHPVKQLDLADLSMLNKAIIKTVCVIMKGVIGIFPTTSFLAPENERCSRP